MGEFSGIPVSMTPMSQDDWRIEADFIYRSERYGTVKVPAGFRTDFASVPRPLWSLYPKWGTYGYAAIVHDYLYNNARSPLDRAQADRVFLEAMQALNVPRLRCYVLFTAVRVGGWLAWRKARRIT